MSGSHSKIDQDGKLGPVSFHPRKFTDNFLYGKDIKWKIGDECSASPKVAAGESAEKTSGLVGGNITRSGEKSSGKTKKSHVCPPSGKRRTALRTISCGASSACDLNVRDDSAVPPDFADII